MNMLCSLRESRLRLLLPVRTFTQSAVHGRLEEFILGLLGLLRLVELNGIVYVAQHGSEAVLVLHV